ncbi:unnamed protein product [Allacma fusca]|uniref:Uncharacterized protein n=1 Tax=Allacma fusca TaxID=39272 RepID=A0A8J2LLA6_9HEXA|nr:unnamed protein product [Allacma fusca]
MCWHSELALLKSICRTVAWLQSPNGSSHIDCHLNSSSDEVVHRNSANTSDKLAPHTMAAMSRQAANCTRKHQRHFLAQRSLNYYISLFSLFISYHNTINNSNYISF